MTTQNILFAPLRAVDSRIFTVAPVPATPGPFLDSYQEEPVESITITVTPAEENAINKAVVCAVAHGDSFTAEELERLSSYIHWPPVEQQQNLNLTYSRPAWRVLCKAIGIAAAHPDGTISPREVDLLDGIALAIGFGELGWAGQPKVDEAPAQLTA